MLELFGFEDNDAMTQFQFELSFPTVELAFWWPEISWKPSTLAVTLGAPLGKRKNCFCTPLKKKSHKKQPVVLVDIPYVIGCRDVCGS